VCRYGSPRILVLLDHREHCLQDVQSLAEHQVLFCQGNLLFHGGADPKDLTNFTKRLTKTGC
jgi:hypothetical protein